MQFQAISRRDKVQGSLSEVQLAKRSWSHQSSLTALLTLVPMWLYTVLSACRAKTDGSEGEAHSGSHYEHYGVSGGMKDSFSLPARTQVQIFTPSFKEQNGSIGLERFLDEEV